LSGKKGIAEVGGDGIRQGCVFLKKLTRTGQAMPFFCLKRGVETGRPADSVRGRESNVEARRQKTSGTPDHKDGDDGT